MKIDNVIICDFIRKEDNGKPIMIGVYLENIQFLKFPATIGLTTWVQFHVGTKGKTEFEFRFLKDRKPLATGAGELNIKDTKKQITLTVPTIALVIEGPGTLSCQIREKGKRWQTLKKFPVFRRKKK